MKTRIARLLMATGLAAAATSLPVGVASGHYSAGELAQAGADYVLGSLTEAFPGM